MWGKIIKLACVIGACILSTNFLFISFCLITNIAFRFDIFACVLIPAAMAIFVVSVMDSAAFGDAGAERLNKKIDKEISESSDTEKNEGNRDE